MNERPTARYPKAVMSVFTVNFMQTRNPNIVLWWSAAIPGFGHLMLGKYIQGIILITWEIFTNHLSHLNEGIFYSMQGDAFHGKEVLNTRWLLLYVVVYVYTIWDSYRNSIIMNKLNILSENNKARIPNMKLTTWGINVLSPVKPWLAVLSSLFIPGLGQIFLQRFITGCVILFVWVKMCVDSNVLLGIHFALLGDFEISKQVILPNDLMFLPSVFGFAVYDAYHSAIAMNNLYVKEQSCYLYQRYVLNRKQEPFMKRSPGQESTYTAATFANSIDLEVMLLRLEESGVLREQLLVLPMASPKEKNKYTSGYLYRGEDLLNLAFPLGTICMLLGVIYGYVLPLGPIIWGLIGILVGLSVGIGITWLLHGRKFPRKKLDPEVIVMLHCPKRVLPSVMDIMSDYLPIRVVSETGPPTT